MIPFLEFNATNPFTFWSPSFIQNLYIFSMIIGLNVLFILAAWQIIRYLKRFYGERRVDLIEKNQKCFSQSAHPHFLPPSS